MPFARDPLLNRPTTKRRWLSLIGMSASGRS